MTLKRRDVLAGFGGLAASAAWPTVTADERQHTGFPRKSDFNIAEGHTYINGAYTHPMPLVASAAARRYCEGRSALGAARSGAARPDAVAPGLVSTVWLPFAFAYFLAYGLRNVNAVLAPELTRELSLSAAQLGFLTSVFFVTFAAVQLPAGMLLDRFGSRRVHGVLLLVAAVGCALHALGTGFLELVIGRALMGRPELLLLDEPSMGLAPIIVAQIFEIIREINDQGTTVLLVEQNAAQALGLAHRGYALATGSIVLEGPADLLLADPRVREAYLGEGA